MKVFHDRETAGRALGERLSREAITGDIVVLGLPRGGVPVACEVGAALGAPVDALVVRKLGAPFNPELAVGAIAFGGVTVYNEDLLEQLALDEADVEPIRRRELAELARREQAYRPGLPPLDVRDRTVILVDDGMATGATMHAAALAVRAQAPQALVVAVPTAARDAVSRLEQVADRVVALATPEPYFGVGAWYSVFRQLDDAEVVSALASAAKRQAAAED
jgi:putative phosphoribosyl transferase